MSNQEDSLVINQGAIDRGLFNGCKFTFYKTELEQREEFANPDVTNTTDIKAACYDKLVNGIIKKGTIIHKNDAIIGKVMKLTGKNAEDNYQYIDRSIIYKEEEPAVVHNVIIDRNEDDEQFAKVVLRKLRPVYVGDKFSMKPTAQVLTDQGWIKLQNLDITKHKVATMKEDHTLDYVYPSGLSKYEYDDQMYIFKNMKLYMEVTKNHKLYVKKYNRDYFELLPTNEVIGKRMKFKKWIQNAYPDQEYYEAKDIEGNVTKYSMDAWLKLVGMFISDGYVPKSDNGQIIICAVKKRKQEFHIQFLKDLGVKFKQNKKETSINGNKYKAMYNEIQKLSLYASNKCLPNYVWALSERQSRVLLDALIEGDGTRGTYSDTYFTSSIKLANDITKLAFHCGWSGTITLGRKEGTERNSLINGIKKLVINNYDEHRIVIQKRNEPQINHSESKNQGVQEENYYHYKGEVICLEIPDTHQHVYYARENDFSPACWTGNSARSGQKGTIGLTLYDEDMPCTENGIKPSIIMNPHGLPSRMTIGQLIESLSGTLCAEKCAQVDATMFKKVDVESIAIELENLGLDRYGYQRLYSGITGEYIDCEIFMGPTYYQRLQKFTIDTQYATAKGASDILTYQPNDGKSSSGGLRLGEMELWALESHGGAKLMTEKLLSHSDGFTEYICKNCGKTAVVNQKENIYKCNYCKDNADIYAAPTSWSAKLFVQELESMNVGIRRKGDPYTYEIQDPKIYEILDESRKA